LGSTRRRQLALAALGVLLTLAVVGGNAAAGADRTLLDAGYVTDGLEAEGVYETTADSMAETLQPNDTAALAPGLEDAPDPPVEEMASAAVTPAYVREEIDRNVENLYASLHGRTDDLDLRLDLEPVKAGFVGEVEAWVADLEPGEIDDRMGRLAANQSAFVAARGEFKEAHLERIQERTDEEYSREELEGLYDENRERIRREAIDRLETTVADAGGPPRVEDALVTYGTVGVDALVAEDASYEQFTEVEADAREELAAAIGAAVRERLDAEVDDEAALTARMDESDREMLATARTGVSTVSVLALVLPVAALVLAALFGYASRRRSSALWRVGGIVAAVGLLTAVATTVLAEILPGLVGIDGGDTPESAAAVIGVVRRALGAIGTQSLLLFVLGLALVGAGIAIRRELVPVEDEPTAADGAAPAD
jgi:hypothetical protein